MRGINRCQGSTGRMKKHRYGSEFKVTAVTMATAQAVETKAVAEALDIPPVHALALEERVSGGGAEGSAHPYLKELKAMEVIVAKAQRIRRLEAALTAYIRFYNHYRLYSGIDYHTPEEYERLMA